MTYLFDKAGKTSLIMSISESICSFIPSVGCIRGHVFKLWVGAGELKGGHGGRDKEAKTVHEVKGTDVCSENNGEVVVVWLTNQQSEAAAAHSTLRQLRYNLRQSPYSFSHS